MNPSTGRELWRYDPKMDLAVPSHFCRGVASWSGSEQRVGEPCEQRILSTTGDGRLIALDLTTGALCKEFGDRGSVDLTANLGPLKPGEYYQTAPPLVIRDLILTGSAVRDGFRTDTAGGVIRAWNVRSGKLVWAWDPVGPSMQPVTAADAEAGRVFTRGTPNVWSFMSADADRGLVYLPTGNAPPDHFKGAERNIDYYGSSVVALEAATGRVVWRFQLVHHDLWDYDSPAQPVLYEQGPVPALAIASKMGHIFLLNRVTGKPLFPVEERAVPSTDVPGEWSSPTQPFPTRPKPMYPERLTESDLNQAPFLAEGCKARFQSLRNEGLFTPPSLTGTLQDPGVAGGFNWGSGSIDPRTLTLVATYLRMPFIVKLIPRRNQRTAEEDNAPMDSSEMPQYGAPYEVTGRVPFLSAQGVPCVKPPWGSIVAFNLASGMELWRRPVGSLLGRVPLIGSVLEVGVPVAGGTLQTASGLVFVGATMDETFRAFDAKSGNELWSTHLAFSGHATPMSYRLTKDSRQYVVIATGGTAGVDARLGLAVVAFALPD